MYSTYDVYWDNHLGTALPASERFREFHMKIGNNPISREEIILPVYLFFPQYCCESSTTATRQDSGWKTTEAEVCTIAAFEINDGYC